MTHPLPDRDAGPDQDPSPDGYAYPNVLTHPNRHADRHAIIHPHPSASPNGYRYAPGLAHPDGHADRHAVIYPHPFASPNGYRRAYNLSHSIVSLACPHGRPHRPTDASPYAPPNTFPAQTVAHTFAEPPAQPLDLVHNFTCADTPHAANRATGFSFTPLLRPLHRATAPAHGRTYSDVGAGRSQGSALLHSLVAARPNGVDPFGPPDRFPIPPPALNIPM